MTDRFCGEPWTLLATVKDDATFMGTFTRVQVLAVAQLTVADPVPLLVQVPGAFSLKVPIAPFSVTLAPSTGHDTITLTVAVPVATVFVDAGFHRHSHLVGLAGAA